MEIEKLKKILIIVGKIHTTDWQLIRDLVEVIREGKTEILNKEWADSYKQKNQDFFPLNLGLVETWSTFDACRDLYFSFKGDRLFCHAVIYDGNSFGGNRTYKRFDVDLFLPIEFLEKLDKFINWEFSSYLEIEHEKYLEKQKQEWINKLANELLNEK